MGILYAGVVESCRGKAQQVGLYERGERALQGVGILDLNLATRANQDDAGDTFALHALHVPTAADGFLNARQPVIAVPAAALACGADGVQRVMDVQHDPLGCFYWAQTHLRSISIYRHLPNRA